MRNSRPIAVLICIFLLLGQYASVLHAVEDFYTEIPDSHCVSAHSGQKHLRHEHLSHEHLKHEHLAHKHSGHKHSGHKQINFSVTGNDGRQGEKHGDSLCLVFHLHGNVQASMPAPFAVAGRNESTEAKIEVFVQVAVEATTRCLAIRAPPVIS